KPWVEDQTRSIPERATQGRQTCCDGVALSGLAVVHNENPGLCLGLSTCAPLALALRLRRVAPLRVTTLDTPTHRTHLIDNTLNLRMADHAPPVQSPEPAQRSGSTERSPERKPGLARLVAIALVVIVLAVVAGMIPRWQARRTLAA